MPVVAGIAAIATSVGGGVYNKITSDDANAEAKKQLAAQQTKDQALVDEQTKQAQDQATLATLAAQRKAQSASYFGGEPAKITPTMATGALGIPGQPKTSQKTLLGV